LDVASIYTGGLTTGTRLAAVTSICGLVWNGKSTSTEHWPGKGEGETVAKAKFHVYVIGLDKEFALTGKARKANPEQKLDKPCIYIGYTSKTPEERFQEHINGARNRKGRLYSSVVYKYGKYLQPRKYEKCNPIDTREEALRIEKELAEKYRRKGYTVWSH